MMFVFIRALTYASLFVGVLLIYLPAVLLRRSGIAAPVASAVWRVAGTIIATAGALLALWCIATFIWIGKGTLAPFDPPRRLVVRGPYRFVRNPMYLGAALALSGAALFYGAMWLAAYSIVFLLATHVFVVGYEEPTLRRTFGDEYRVYTDRVGRWWPTLK